MVSASSYKSFSSKLLVSRETILDLKNYEKLLIKANENTNLIGKSTINTIWDRHFLDSYQAIDFIDENDKLISDLGTGAGFPGLVLAIIFKNKNKNMKITLIEKSPKKIKFLERITNELNLKVELMNGNAFNENVKLDGDVFVARAFKPLKKILELIHKKAQNWKKIIIFLGKTGKDDLVEASKIWDIEYKQKKSITNSDSIIININKLKKK